MSEPRSCTACLRRARLLAYLSPYLEHSVDAANPHRVLELLDLGNEALARTVAPAHASELLARIEGESEDALRSDLAESRCWAFCRHDPLFPSALWGAAAVPRALFGKGDPQLLSALSLQGAVTVIGERTGTSYGRKVARELGHDLAAVGIVVLGGLGFGIDTCAHRGALETGRTVAVVPSGVDIPHPAAHSVLWGQICEGGLALSELPPGCGAWRWSFTARDRILVALSGMTIVVEAAKDSGSMIAADLAAGIGRDLGAVPGPVGSRVSAGPNELLAGGACLIRDAQDALDALLGPGVRQVSGADRLNPLQRLVLEAVGESSTCEKVAATLSLSEGEAAIALATLEALDYLRCSLTGVYTPAAERSRRSRKGA